jgi:hypothetical protein
LENFVRGALLHLETFTKETLTDEEHLLWTARLMKYPKKKLSRLTEYTGRLNNEVFRFLDDLRDGHTGVLDGLKQLPPPKSNIAKECMAYVEQITKEEYARTPAGDELERKFMAKMRIKYPHGGWVCGRKANMGVR